MLRIRLAVLIACAAYAAERFPRPDAQGGWPKPTNDAGARRVSGMDIAKPDEAFRYIQTTTKNGGLLRPRAPGGERQHRFVRETIRRSTTSGTRRRRPSHSTIQALRTKSRVVWNKKWDLPA